MEYVNNNDERFDIGKRIRKRREELGIRQEDIIGLGRSTISNYENGKISDSKLKVSQLLKLCDALQCDPDFLLCFDDYENRDMRFIGRQTGLSAEALKLLCAYKTTNTKYTSPDNAISALNYILSHVDGYAFIERLGEYFTYCKDLNDIEKKRTSKERTPFKQSQKDYLNDYEVIKAKQSASLYELMKSLETIATKYNSETHERKD